MDDDLYKNDGEATGYYETDDSGDETPQRAEQHLIGGSYPIMDELLEWFENQISQYENLSSVIVDDKMDDAHIARQVMVNKLVANILRSKCNDLDHKFNSYKEDMNGGSDG